MHSSNTLNESGLGRLLSLNTPQPAQSNRDAASASGFGETLAEARRDLHQPQPKPRARPYEREPLKPEARSATATAQPSRDSANTKLNQTQADDRSDVRDTGSTAARQDTAATSAPADETASQDSVQNTEQGEVAAEIPVAQEEVHLETESLVAEDLVAVDSSLDPEIVSETGIEAGADEATPATGGAESPQLELAEIDSAETPTGTPVAAINPEADVASIETPIPVVAETAPDGSDLHSSVTVAGISSTPQSTTSSGAGEAQTGLTGMGQKPMALEPGNPGAVGQKQVAEMTAKPEAVVGEQESLLALPTKSSFARLLAGKDTGTGRETTSTSGSPSLANAAALHAARAPEPLLSAARSFVPQPTVPATLGQPQWSQAVGDRVLWLASQNLVSAELRLDPPELGPMQVRVSVQNDQVQVTFTSPHASVREALDQSAVRLREMFNEQGLNLSMDVSDQSLARRQSDDDSSGKGRNSGNELEDEDQVIADTPIAQVRLVDHYA